MAQDPAQVVDLVCHEPRDPAFEDGDAAIAVDVLMFDVDDECTAYEAANVEEAEASLWALVQPAGGGGRQHENAIPAGTGHAAVGDKQRYLVVDVEGNGARPPDLVEFAAVPINGGVIGEPRSWLVRPTSPITRQVRTVHGITNEDVADQPTFDALRDPVTRLLADEIVVVGHNVHIDLHTLATSENGLPRGARELHELGGVPPAEPMTRSQPGLF